MKADEWQQHWRQTWSQGSRVKWARMHWQARKNVGFSAADAARALQMPAGTYRAYERDPSTSKYIPLGHQAAIQFGRKFKVDWTWLLTGEGTPFDNQLNETQERVIRAMSQASEDQQEAVADMVERILLPKSA